MHADGKQKAFICVHPCESLAKICFPAAKATLVLAVHLSHKTHRELRTFIVFEQMPLSRRPGDTWSKSE